MDEFRGCKYCCWAIDDHEHEENLQSILDDKIIPLRAKMKFGILGRHNTEVSGVVSGDGVIAIDTEVRLTATIFDKGHLWITVDEACWDDRVFETMEDGEHKDEAIAREILPINFCPMCGRYIADDS